MKNDRLTAKNTIANPRTERNCNRSKGEIFNRIIKQLSETEEEIEDSIEGWEKIMNEGI